MLKKIWNPFRNCFRHHTSCNSNSYFIRNFPETRCSMLCNGLTIATEERQSSNVCIGFYIGSGSRYENEKTNGFTHFFEHVAFKGTRQRAKAALESDISNTGAKFKCFTNREITVYYVECLARDLLCVTDILFDCVFNNAFVNDEVEFQKNVVYQEMLKHDVSTVNVLYDYLHSTAYQGTPLAQTVMGPSKNLFSLNCANLNNFVSKMFIPQQTVLVAVGGIKHESIVSLGEKYLSHTVNAEPIDLGPKRYTGSEIVYRNDSLLLAHLAIAVEGPAYTHDDRLIMDLVTSFLGGWDASQPGGINHGTRLAHFGSAGGLCEAYKAFNFHYRDTGLCGIEFISPRLETDDMVLTIQQQLMRLCHMITDGELVKAKNELKSKILNKVQTTTGAFHDIGQYIFRAGYRPSIYEQMNAIDNITADTFKSICYKYFYDKCPVIAGIGSTEGLLQYSRTRGWMYWLRV
ncbi:cytochrome b-c1 complex subunit 1, mitochondrial-like [Maniola jurtina]|uniref:cytochrome b-c1 complex subunit 1, mitochondrial-like n=1 Tax=Maniola jurtina TaxID=191418 RepID=UPI001E688701|nr:cytochrome b-c1 complex subunit 1, mitochondrial-like [Maniola jurtina]